MGHLLLYVRGVHFAATLLMAGTAFFVVLIADAAFRKAPNEVPLALAFRRRVAQIVWISFGTLLLSGALWLVLTAASMSGQPLANVYTQGVLWTVLSQTDFGNDWVARFVFACMLAGAFVPLSSAKGSVRPWLKMTAVVFATALVGSLAWAGHAIGAQGIEGIVHPVADALHLVAAAAWLGALVPLALLLSLTGEHVTALASARTATLRFSTLGILSVATLLFTGIVNSWYLVGSIPALTRSEYGRLLLIKIALFAAMVAFAAVNRTRLTPQLLDGADLTAAQRARGALCRNATIEASLGAAVIAIVAVLGTLPPGSHAHHHSAEAVIPAEASFQHIHGEDGMADVMIEPGRVGPAKVIIHILSDDLKTLAVRQITLNLTPPTPRSKPIMRAAVQDADGNWRVEGIELTAAGNWTVAVDALLSSNKHLELTASIVIDAK